MFYVFIYIFLYYNFSLLRQREAETIVRGTSHHARSANDLTSRSVIFSMIISMINYNLIL